MSPIAGHNMVNVRDASALTLPEVLDRLQLEVCFERDFSPYLALAPLADSEIAQVAELGQNWQRYYLQGKISENQGRCWRWRSRFGVGAENIEHRIGSGVLGVRSGQSSLMTQQTVQSP